jgi:DNA-binding response OmpR family regulator
MRLLLIEDDADVATALRETLEAKAYSVDVAQDGESGLNMAKDTPYDLVILDHVLPKMTGREVCEALRRSGNMTPVLMLTVRQETQDKVAALDTGADDYLTKPFSTDELLARIRALLRRPKQVSDRVLKVGDLELDSVKQVVKRGGKDVYVTRKEYALLEHLMLNEDSVCSRDALIEHVWGMGTDPSTNSLEMHIMSLRKKLESAGKKRLIHTVAGRGYRMSSKI